MQARTPRTTKIMPRMDGVGTLALLCTKSTNQTHGWVVFKNAWCFRLPLSLPQKANENFSPCLLLLLHPTRTIISTQYRARSNSFHLPAAMLPHPSCRDSSILPPADIRCPTTNVEQRVHYTPARRKLDLQALCCWEPLPILRRLQ